MKISVVIPVYNAVNSLLECISSLNKFDPSDKEIILIDDGSTDGSSILCDKISKELSNIKVLHQKNLGPSQARNNGLKVVTGDYFFFLSACSQ